MSDLELPSRPWKVVGVASGLASKRHETNLGPAALRKAGLVDRLSAVAPGLDAGFDLAEPAASDPGDPKERFAAVVSEFTAGLCARVLSDVYGAGYRPVVVGGDHSLSIGTVAAASQYIRQKTTSQGAVGLLWVDAHADLNTPQTTFSGNIHGMSVASLLGLGSERLTSVGAKGAKIAPEHIVYVGLRDLDPGERDLLRKLRIKAYTMKDVDIHGMAVIMRQALSYLSAQTSGFVVSFDMDVCDPALAPGVGTPVRGGLSFREAHLVMEMAAETPGLMSVEVVELNPACDVHGTTAELGIALLESALGKRIL